MGSKKLGFKASGGVPVCITTELPRGCGSAAGIAGAGPTQTCAAHPRRAASAKGLVAQPARPAWAKVENTTQRRHARAPFSFLLAMFHGNSHHTDLPSFSSRAFAIIFTMPWRRGANTMRTFAAAYAFKVAGGPHLSLT